MMKLDLFYYKYHNEKKVEALAPSHIHYYDLTLCLKGELAYAADGKRLVVPAGGAILMPPGSKRQRFSSDRPTEYASFNFKTDEPLTLPLLLEDCVKNDVKLILYACNELKSNPSGYSEEQFLHLTAAILFSLKKHAKNERLSRLTLAAEQYVRAHYAEKLSLRKIADDLAYSPSYCDALFKKEKGTSIIDFLIEYRLEKAKELLLENRLTLSEIAEAAGFSEYNYFSRQFKKRTGVTPLKYRLGFIR